MGGLTIEYMMGADVNGDKLVEMQEWLLDKQSPLAKEMLLAVYDKYDTNKDQSLSFAELEKGIKETGMTLSFMAGADKDGDEKVSKEEWLQFFDPIPDSEVAEIKKWLLSGK